MFYILAMKIDKSFYESCREAQTTIFMIFQKIGSKYVIRLYLSDLMYVLSVLNNTNIFKWEKVLTNVFETNSNCAFKCLVFKFKCRFRLVT